MTTNTDGAMPELLPCPFCSGKAAVVPRAVNIALQKDPSDPKFGVSIICAQCSSETANMIDEAHAAAKWNRRAAIQQADGAVPEVDLIERIATHWDGCMYDSHAEGEVDIGEAIRQNARCFSVPFIPPELDQAQPKQQPVHLGGGEGGGVPQWQPIETAPKDGTYILLGSADGAWVARFHAVYQSGYRPENPWQSMMLNHEHLGRYPKARPTHWMPLPPPPARGNDAPTGQINKPAGQGMEGGK